MAGYRDYRDNGLNEPATVREATDTYHRNSDAVGRFIVEQCHVGTMFRATTRDLYEAWQQWQVADGCEPMGRGAFGNALDGRGYPASRPVHGKRWRTGIGIAKEQDE